MTGRVVRSGVQGKVHEQSAEVLGGVQVGSAKSVRQVITEERSLGGLVDRDSVSLQLQRLNGLAHVREHNGLGGNGRGQELVRAAHGIERNTGVNDSLNLRLGLAVKLLVSEQGQSVPVAVLVQVVARDVLGGAQTNEHVLNGPLHLRQQLGLLSVNLAELLVSVNADQGESDSLDINIRASNGRFDRYFK